MQELYHRTFFLDCACLIRDVLIALSKIAGTFFPEEVLASLGYQYLLCPSVNEILICSSIYAFNPTCVFYKRKRDSPLFMFPSGQGRQVCSPAHPCAPPVPQGSHASCLTAGGGCAIQICISSLSLHGAWMTPDKW